MNSHSLLSTCIKPLAVDLITTDSVETALTADLAGEAVRLEDFITADLAGEAVRLEDFITADLAGEAVRLIRRLYHCFLI